MFKNNTELELCQKVTSFDLKAALITFICDARTIYLWKLTYNCKLIIENINSCYKRILIRLNMNTHSNMFSLSL